EGPLVDGGQTLDDVDGVLGTVVGATFNWGHQGSFGEGQRRRRREAAQPFEGATRRNLADSRPFVNRGPLIPPQNQRTESSPCRKNASPIRALGRPTSPRAPR